MYKILVGRHVDGGKVDVDGRKILKLILKNRVCWRDWIHLAEDRILRRGVRTR